MLERNAKKGRLVYLAGKLQTPPTADSPASMGDPATPRIRPHDGPDQMFRDAIAPQTRQGRVLAAIVALPALAPYERAAGCGAL